MYQYHDGALYVDCRSVDHHDCDKCGKHIGGTLYPSQD